MIIGISNQPLKQMHKSSSYKNYTNGKKISNNKGDAQIQQSSRYRNRRNKLTQASKERPKPLLPFDKEPAKSL